MGVRYKRVELHLNELSRMIFRLSDGLKRIWQAQVGSEP
jgi:hypothetical protein